MNDAPTAATTLYPGQATTTGPIRENYRQAAPAPAAMPAASSAAAPATDPPAEPLTPAQMLYGSGDATLGNRIAADGIRKDDAPTVDAAPASGETLKPGEANTQAKPETKTETEITAELSDNYRAIRFGEPEAADVKDYNAIAFPGADLEVGDPEIMEFAQAAAQHGGLGITQADFLLGHVKDFARHGPSNHTPESAMATLKAWHGDKADEVLTNANKQIDKMSVMWPGLRKELTATNLGNHPEVIKMLAEVYSRRRK